MILPAGLTEADVERAMDELGDWGWFIGAVKMRAALTAAIGDRVVVPREPTSAMGDAAQAVPDGIGGSPPSWKNIYRAMIAAASPSRVEGE